MEIVERAGEPQMVLVNNGTEENGEGISIKNFLQMKRAEQISQPILSN